MAKKYYRVDVEKGIPGSKKRYSAGTFNYYTISKQSAINKAKREGVRSRTPKQYKLYYSVILID